MSPPKARVAQGQRQRLQKPYKWGFESLVAHVIDAESVVWLKSKSCIGGCCIEVGMHPDGSVLVRDTKSPLQMLRFTQEEWHAFVDGVNNGEFRF